jgi:copper(I)-binding protein
MKAMPEKAGDDVVKAGELEISGVWTRAMLPGQPTGGGYLTVTNKGKSADRLLSVSTPDAGRAEIHSMTMKDNVMVMRPVEGGLEIPAGGTVELKPGHFHLMFMDVKKPFRKGDTIPVTLDFEKTGKVEISMPVEAANAKEPHGGMGGMKMN